MARFVCSSVKTELFFRTGSLVFSVFCIKLRDHRKFSKLTEPNFWEKFLLVLKRAKKSQNGPIYSGEEYQHHMGNLKLSRTPRPPAAFSPSFKLDLFKKAAVVSFSEITLFTQL